MLYRLPKEPFEPGKLRTKTWNAQFEPPTGEDDIKWSARARQYWELQERLYGVRFSNFTMMVSEMQGGALSHPLVTTVAVVLEVLPGERTFDYSRVTPEMVAGRQ